ncbi:phosphatase PAP2 family protein [uncultured Mucilaginibacter sp.]|uniref:phosphatase PAP2 family protein n=1 Tax=uncultured Mucilaginibacter sp. TaxID=797541 RepID=UPI00261A5370|nr:phosphatase PAP2 family protein [uncultured Mucilaginibacter sp.]
MKVKLSEFLHKISSLLYPYMVLLAFCVLLMLVFSKEEIYFAINHIHTAFADVFFENLTNLGDSLGCTIIAIIVFLINFRKGFLLATSYIISFIISQTIKHLVKAPRPHLFFAKKLSGIYLVKGVTILDTNSFPSGHSVSAFTAALVLTYVAKKKWWGSFMLIFAVLIAYSRMYLSEHFLIDVTAGSALGIVVTSIWLFWIDRHPFLQSPKWDRGIFGSSKSQSA